MRLLHLGNVMMDLVLAVPALPERGGDVLATASACFVTQAPRPSTRSTCSSGIVPSSRGPTPRSRLPPIPIVSVK